MAALSARCAAALGCRDGHRARPPIAEALAEALAIGDTGYPEGTAYAEAFAEFAIRRWGWALDVGACANVPDVMTGVVEVLKLLTESGDSVVINSPVYPPFYGFVKHMDRQVIEAPLNAEHRIDLAALDAGLLAGRARRPTRGVLAVQPAQPHRDRAHERGALRRRRACRAPWRAGRRR